MTTDNRPWWYPTATPASEIAVKIAIIVRVRRDPSRVITGPESGREITDPAALARSTSPRLAGVSSSASRTWGIRDAQLAKANPAAMNAR